MEMVIRIMKTMKSEKIVILLLMMILCMTTGCSSSEDNKKTNTSPACNCDNNPVVKNNGLVFRFDRQDVKKPANIAVYFKLETTKGEPVPNLPASAFEIFEDDAAVSGYESQKNVFSNPEDMNYYTLLVLDLSGSMRGDDNLDKLKEAAGEFVRVVMDETDIDNPGKKLTGINWFDGSANLHKLVSFEDDLQKLLDGIDSIDENISNDTSTNLYGAVIDNLKILENVVGNKSDGKSVGALAVFTDGTDQAAIKTRKETEDAVNKANEDISIFTIGLGHEIDTEILKAIGKSGSIFSDDITELVPKFKATAMNINNDSKSRYVLKYCSPKRKGKHSLTIEVSYNNDNGSITTCFCADGFEGGCTISDETLALR